jgi:nitrite reductase/ring-hydroxylating ferredoxin subunit
MPGEGAAWGIVGPVAAFRDGQAHEVYVDGHPLLVVALDGRIYAVEGRCPHRNALLTEGRLEGRTIVCPMHGFRFDVCSGACLWPVGGPDARTYDTRVEGELLLVRRAW